MRYWYLSLVVLLAMQGMHAKEGHHLTVVGQASLSQPADLLELVLGVETYGADVQKAVQENKAKLTALVAALVQGGVSEKEIHLRDYTIIPQQASPPRDPPPTWVPSIVGYQVRNLLEIRTPALDTAARILDNAARTGGNLVEGITFTLKEAQAARDAALAQAVRNARASAKSVAKEAGLVLGEVVSLTVQNVYAHTGTARLARSMGGESAPTVSPRDVEVTASVSVVYEIAEEKHKK